MFCLGVLTTEWLGALGCRSSSEGKAQFARKSQRSHSEEIKSLLPMIIKDSFCVESHQQVVDTSG